MTPSRGDTRPKINFLWLNLERILDTRRGKMGVVRRRQQKRSSLSEAMTKKGDQIFKKKIGAGADPEILSRGRESRRRGDG